MKELLDCTGCDHCCDYITFTINARSMPDSRLQALMKYYEARGCTLLKDVNNVHITVKAPCPQKTDDGEFDNMPKGCKVHGSKDKPEFCRAYDCRHDPFLPVGGNYNK